MTAYDKTLTETITPADTITKGLNRTLSESITPDDALVRGVSIIIVETITPADTLSKGTTRVLSEAVTPADTFVKGLGLILAETITPADEIHNFHLMDLSGYNTKNISVSKAWGDQLWNASLDIVGTDIPDPFTQFKLSMDDAETEDSETIFLGFIPGADYVLKKDFETVKVRAFDYTWYLAAQFLPKALASTDSAENPSAAVEDILGGNDWRNTTGIYPFRIEDVPSWSTIAKQWNWDPWKTTRWQAIQDICKYTGMIFVVLWKYQPTAAFTGWMPCAYFLTEAQWDDATNKGNTGASAVDKTVDASTSVLPSTFSYQNESLQQINRIKVIVQDDVTGTWYEATSETADVTNNLELPREKTWGPVCGKWTQAQADARAAALLTEYGDAAEIFRAELQAATKLRLGQKIQFTNVSGHPTDLMRITQISHSGAAVAEKTSIEYSKLNTFKMTKERTESAGLYREVQSLAAYEADKATEKRKNREAEIVARVGEGLYDVKILSTGQVLKSVRLI